MISAGINFLNLTRFEHKVDAILKRVDVKFESVDKKLERVDNVDVRVHDW